MVGRAVQTQRSTPVARSASTPRLSARGPHASLLALQRTAGNRAVCQLVSRNGDKKKKKGGGAGSTDQKRLKAAPNQSEYKFAQLPDDVRTAITQILAGNGGPYLRPTNGGRHSTDPETGLPKGPGIGVLEYHVSASNESKRIVTRNVNQDKRVYYDPSHVAGTYTYHRVTGAPFPVAAPVPAPAPAPAPAAVVPVAAPAAAPVLPAVQAPPLPEVDDWEQL
jgi:hypothetical protein